MKKTIFFIALTLLCSLSTSCGYTTRSNMSLGFRTIYVENFKNSIDFSSGRNVNLYLPLLEVDARNAVINRFMIDGNLHIAKPEDADLILKGELKGYYRNPLRYTDNEDVEEYRVRIAVSFQLYDTKTGQELWSEPNFSGDATYFVSGPKASSETSAVNEALRDLARRIVERTVDNW